MRAPLGTSYKFRVVAVNVIGPSPPSAPSKAYTVVGGRTHERPVDGPYITYNEAINETTIILKWTVSNGKYINYCFCSNTILEFTFLLIIIRSRSDY